MDTNCDLASFSLLHDGSVAISEPAETVTTLTQETNPLLDFLSVDEAPPLPNTFFDHSEALIDFGLDILAAPFASEIQESTPLSDNHSDYDYSEYGVDFGYAAESSIFPVEELVDIRSSKLL